MKLLLVENFGRVTEAIWVSQLDKTILFLIKRYNIVVLLQLDVFHTKSRTISPSWLWMVVNTKYNSYNSPDMANLLELSPLLMFSSVYKSNLKLFKSVCNCRVNVFTKKPDIMLNQPNLAKVNLPYVQFISWKKYNKIKVNLGNINTPVT